MEAVDDHPAHGSLEPPSPRQPRSHAIESPARDTADQQVGIRSHRQRALTSPIFDRIEVGVGSSSTADDLQLRGREGNCYPLHEERHPRPFMRLRQPPAGTEQLIRQWRR